MQPAQRGERTGATTRRGATAPFVPVPRESSRASAAFGLEPGGDPELDVVAVAAPRAVGPELPFVPRPRSGASGAAASAPVTSSIAASGSAPSGSAPSGSAPSGSVLSGSAPSGSVPSEAAAPEHDAPWLGARAGAPAPRVWRDDLGVLAPYAADPAVTDLFVNGAQGLFIDRGRGPVREAGWRAGEAEVRALASSLIACGGRHVDEATPCVDVRLADGVRVHAVLPPIARHGTTLSIRVPRLGQPSLEMLAAGGMFGGDPALLAWLRHVVRSRTNLLIAGAAGAGKTTLLAALLAEASADERIVTIEDVAELQIDHPHHVALEARQANIEGAGEIGLARLVREALRMRPDRLVVGECRGTEVRELLSALNTGHAGGAGTVHANGLSDVAARLEALGALCGMSDQALARQAVSAIGLVLHVERTDAGHRLAGAGVLDVRGGRLVVEETKPWRG